MAPITFFPAIPRGRLNRDKSGPAPGGERGVTPTPRFGVSLRSKRGFTLIELLVVISIIGLLASIAMTSLASARVRGRDAQRIANVKQIMNALELYYEDNGSYPASGGAASPNSGWDNSNDSSWNDLTAVLDPYLKLPDDPINSPSGWANQSGVYTLNYFSLGYGCSQQWYMIVYALENPGTISSPGVTACNGTTFRYSGLGAITIGQSGVQN